LDAISHEKSSRQLAFESRIELARVLTDLGETDRALAVLEDLERRTSARDDLDRILLARGRTYEAVGRYEQAKEVFDTVVFEHERSDAAAMAYYRIGLIERDHAASFDDAIEAFREAKEQAPRSEAAALASAAIKGIEDLREYLAVIEADERGEAPGESTEPEGAGGDGGDADRGAGAPGAGGTPGDSLGVTPLERTAADSTAAGDTLGVSAEDSGARAPEASGGEPRSDRPGPTAPSAADSVAAAQAPSPDTWSVWPPPEGPMPSATAPTGEWAPAAEEESEVAVARFRVAEIYLFELDRPADALTYYESVVREHPTSGLAPKAAYAMAWIAENRTDDPSAAVRAYHRVIDDFPGSPQAAAALEALERLEPDGAGPTDREGDGTGALDAAAQPPAAPTPD
jgi:tetratricopeptide (TPR) repeat protein